MIRVNFNILCLLFFSPFIFSINYKWAGNYTYQYPISVYPDYGFICCEPTTQVISILQDPITSKINASIIFQDNGGCNSIASFQTIFYNNFDVSLGYFIDTDNYLKWNYNPNNFTIAILDQNNYCIYMLNSQNTFLTNMSDYQLDGTWTFFGVFPFTNYAANIATNLTAMNQIPYCLPDPSQNMIIAYDSTTNLTTISITFPPTIICSKLQLNTALQNFTATFIAGSFVYTDIEYYNDEYMDLELSAYYLPYNETLLFQMPGGVNMYYYNSNSTNLATTLSNCTPPDISGMGSKLINSIAYAIITAIFIIIMNK